jgi:thiol:disulfide interchange protein
VKHPPNIVVTLGIAAVALVAIVAVKHFVVDKPQAPQPWLTDEGTAFAQARAHHKHVLIDFSATWSVPSTEMSRALDVLQRTIDARYVRLRIDISNATALADDEVRTRYGVTTSPAVVMVRTDGHVVNRITRMLDADELRAVIR